MVTDWLTLNVLPALRDGTLTLNSKGSLLVTVEDEVAIRTLAVEARAVPVPWFFTVKLTVKLDPTAPLEGLRERFCVIRSGRPVTVNSLFVLSLASLVVPWPAELLTSSITQT